MILRPQFYRLYCRMKKFLFKNKKEILIIIMGEIFIKNKLKKKFNIKEKKLHKLLNIYNYKYH